jgi:tetratricopeptide (TPR) repeat protein
LGDCFFEQAGILRERDERGTLEGLYLQAEDAYRRGGNTRGLAETLLFHGRLLRADGRFEDALGLAGQALSAAEEAEAPSVECRVRGLRAMVLADSGDTSAAREDLGTAETLSEANGLFQQTVWVLARRAYVFAREGQSADEVVQQLRTADQYGTDHDLEALGRRAALRIISEISSNCGEDYAEGLEALRAELRARKAEAAEPEPQSSEASEVAAAQAAADD